MIRNCFGSFSGTSRGTSSADASATRALYSSVCPLPSCRTTPASVRQAPAGTPHRAAAAAISMARAVAPACRIGAQELRMLVLAPVICSGNTEVGIVM